MSSFFVIVNSWFRPPLCWTLWRFPFFFHASRPLNSAMTLHFSPLSHLDSLRLLRTIAFYTILIILAPHGLWTCAPPYHVPRSQFCLTTILDISLRINIFPRISLDPLPFSLGSHRHLHHMAVGNFLLAFELSHSLLIVMIPNLDRSNPKYFRTQNLARCLGVSQ